MTKKEAIGHIKDVIYENNTIKPNIVVFEQEKEALYMAIKALEQEPILDKVRAEIYDLQYGDEEKSMTDEDRADAYNNAIRQVIEIIDKYKAERKENKTNGKI